MFDQQKARINVTHVGGRNILEIDINSKNNSNVTATVKYKFVNKFDLSRPIKRVSHCINASFYIQLINSGSDILTQIVFMLQILHFLDH